MSYEKTKTLNQRNKIKMKEKVMKNLKEGIKKKE